MTPVWRVLWDPSTGKDLRRLGRPASERLREVILSRLAKNPRLGKPLETSSKAQLYRFRVGDYRVIYTLRDKECIILVLRIGHRREIYRRLPQP
ncbi:MAG: type II toxin-antitoxin system RelE/ParE family toxin [Acidobacteriota bacterium]